MKILRQIASGVVLFAVLLLILGAFLPATSTIERTLLVQSPPATVYALLSDIRRFYGWSPRTADDANMRPRFSGPPRGTGATVVWSGPVAGVGARTIVESERNARVVFNLEIEGRPATRDTIELSAASPGLTEVRWQVSTEAGFNIFQRYLGLFLNSIAGPDLDALLDNLKDTAEQLPTADFSDIEIEHQTVDSVDMVVMPARSSPASAAISAALGAAYFRILAFIDRYSLQEAGAPMSIGGTFDGSELTFDAAIPVRGLSEDTPLEAGNMRLAKSYAGPALRVRHVGPYRGLSATHDKIAAYLAAYGIKRNGAAWESYVSDPARVPENELITYVFYPVRTRDIQGAQ